MIPETIHNPDRYMVDLRQILSQGRKRIGLLLGAGAPSSIRIGATGKIEAGGEPLVPDVSHLQALQNAGIALRDRGDDISQAFEVQTQKPELHELIDEAHTCGGFTAREGIDFLRGFAGMNIVAVDINTVSPGHDVNG
jgi:hypothetical protein